MQHHFHDAGGWPVFGTTESYVGDVWPQAGRFQCVECREEGVLVFQWHAQPSTKPSRSGTFGDPADEDCPRSRVSRTNRGIEQENVSTKEGGSRTGNNKRERETVGEELNFVADPHLPEEHLQNTDDLVALQCTARQERQRRGTITIGNPVHGAFQPNGYVNRSRDNWLLPFTCACFTILTLRALHGYLKSRDGL